MFEQDSKIRQPRDVKLHRRVILFQRDTNGPQYGTARGVRPELDPAHVEVPASSRFQAPDRQRRCGRANRCMPHRQSRSAGPIRGKGSHLRIPKRVGKNAKVASWCFLAADTEPQAPNTPDARACKPLTTSLWFRGGVSTGRRDQPEKAVAPGMFVRTGRRPQ